MYTKGAFGIVAYYNHDNTLFDNMVLPTQPQPVDKETVINTIFEKCAEFELLYNNLDFLKNMIGHWSRKYFYNWQKLNETLYYEYNPIWNVDAHIVESEDWNENEDITDVYTRSSTDDSTTIDSVAGYNSENFANANKRKYDDSASGEGNETNNRDRDETRNYDQIRQGNIGVTTTQSMINEERALAEFNIYNYIADSFKTEFCLAIY